MNMSTGKFSTKLRYVNAKVGTFILIWVVCLLYVLFQGGKTSFMLLSMITLLGLYLWISGLSSVSRATGIRRLSSGEEYDDLLHAGDQVHVRHSISIPGFLPLPYVIVREVLHRHTGETWSFEESIIPSMKGEGQLSYQTPSLERGRYSFAETEIVSEDIFGLLENKGRLKVPGDFRVLPRTAFIPHWDLNDYKTRRSGQQSTHVRTRRETTQINGVRDYVYGDRLSRIHWNATARTGSWKSKEYEHETIPKTIVILDQLAKHYASRDQFELAVSCAASLLDYGGRERMRIGLGAAGDGLRVFAASENINDIQKMIQHLVDVDMDDSGDLQIAMEKQLHMLPSGSYMVLISPCTDDRILELLRWADTRGMIPCHVHVGGSRAASSQEEWKELLRMRGIKAYTVSSLEELPAVMGGGGR